MKFQKQSIIILVILAACNSNSKIQPSTRCFVRFDSLFKHIDTSSLEINRNTDSAAIEVLDKNVYEGQRGILRFDENGDMRLYAFLKNDHNDANFFLRYDSIGNHSRSTNAEVVHWNFYRTRDSIIEFTFLLCAFDRNYGDVKIESGKFKKDSIVLFESQFTKLICANVTINRSVIDPNGKIYISGVWQEKCSDLAKSFIDSTTVPDNW